MPTIVIESSELEYYKLCAVKIGRIAEILDNEKLSEKQKIKKIEEIIRKYSPEEKITKRKK